MILTLGKFLPVQNPILFANILLPATMSLLKHPLALWTDVQINDLASSIKQFGRLALKTATLSGLFGAAKNRSPECGLLFRGRAQCVKIYLPGT